jgi:hypothetical protein
MSRLPTSLVLLGEPIEILIGTDPDTAETWTFDRGKFYFGTNGAGRELWILPKPEKRRMTSIIPKKAADMFHRFAGWHPDKAWRCEVSEFRAKRFGNCAAVAYRSNKWSGRKVGYIHTFVHKMSISVDDLKHPGIWRITGAKLRVEARGITG